MRRVLIVTGSYHPAVLADTHRARLLAPELPAFGWEAEVLAPGPEFQRRDSIEPDAARFFSPAVRCHFAGRWGDFLFRLFNIRSIGWRALWPMYRKGAELLKARRFDLVYITTAQFNLFCLGRIWKRKFAVPYILDFHDPWVRKTTYVTTKHRVKFLITALLAKSLEKWAVKGAARIVSVSPDYVTQLRSRYPAAECLRRGRAVVVPFGASEGDFCGRARRAIGGMTLDIVYTGAGGVIMEKSWRAIVDALVEINRKFPELLQGLRFSFFGTEAFWREGEPKFLVAIAKEAGLHHLVEEHPQRISYGESIALIEASNGLLILGVDDPAYMPSKLFTYALTGKPLLACFHSQSQANVYFEQMPGLGSLAHFGVDRAENVGVVQNFLKDVRAQRTEDRVRLLQPYLAPAVAAQHAALFEGCVGGVST